MHICCLWSDSVGGMQRVTWTDERLDDLARSMHTGFERVDHDIRDLRTEMRREFNDLRGDVNDLRTLMVRLSGGLVVGLAGVIAAIAASGAGGI